MKWSRLFSIISIICLASMSVYSQNGKMYGVKGGYSLSNFWGSGTDRLKSSLEEVTTSLDERNLPWFTVSLFSSREMIPDFTAIQSELVYFRGGKAWKGRANGASAESHFSAEIDYIQLPVMLKILLPFPLKPSIYAGPQISWMWRSRMNNFPAGTDTTPFFSGTDDAVPNEIFNRYTNVIDLGFVAGLDFAIPFGPGSIILDGRYVMGALDVFNYSAGRKVRNYAFLMMAGYAIDFGGGY